MNKFKDNDIIKYEYNDISGIGKIVGKSTINQPIIGCLWIVETFFGNIPNDEYDFSVFVCPESFIELL